ncbi:unnamed protein product [Prunus armeniaca]
MEEQETIEQVVMAMGILDLSRQGRHRGSQVNHGPERVQTHAFSSPISWDPIIARVAEARWKLKLGLGPPSTLAQPTWWKCSKRMSLEDEPPPHYQQANTDHSPLINQQHQITSFFSKTTSSPSPISSKSKQTQNPNPSPDPSPSHTTPSPLQSKPKPKKSHGQEVVGKRIRYDDAEEELLDLGKEKIEWVQETIKTLKRLRRGPLSTSNEVVVDGHVVMEDDDEDKEGSNDVADDDSSDEDWG